MSLAGGTATPGSGTTSTGIRFSVLYVDNASCTPTRIVVSITGVGTVALAVASTSPAGVVYARTMTLPAGRWRYGFAATSGSGPGERTATLSTVNPASVTIAAPTAKPTPSPKPPPSPPPPTPVPQPPPPPPPPPPSPPATPAPTPTASPELSDTPQPSASESSTAEPSGSVAAPTIEPSSVPTTRPSATADDGQPVPGTLRPDDLGFGPRLSLPDWLLPYVVLTSAGIGWFLFLVGRRRSADSGPATGMAAVRAAVGSGSQVAPAVTTLPPMRELIPPVDPNLLREADEDAGPRPDEADIPRWLRPSVREGRNRGSRYVRNDNWD